MCYGVLDCNKTKHAVICVEFQVLFHRRAHSTGQHTAFTGVLPCAIHLSAESTVAMHIDSLAQGHNILTYPGLEPPITVLKSRHLTHVTNILQIPPICYKYHQYTTNTTNILQIPPIYYKYHQYTLHLQYDMPSHIRVTHTYRHML